MPEIRLLLGDQLNINHSWFQKTSEHVTYVLCEVRSETDYAPHHIQKVVAFFLGMRHFGDLLKAKGHKVRYFHLDDADNTQSFLGNLKIAINETKADSLAYQFPDEYRLYQSFEEFTSLGVKILPCNSEHWLTEVKTFKALFEGKKTYLMETFYRSMRLKYNILLDGGKPFGGKWNYDHSNRMKLNDASPIPQPLEYNHEAKHIIDLLKSHGVKTIGNMSEDQCSKWPIDRQEAMQMLEFFVDNLLSKFGPYQDAMHTQHWATYHSRLSFALNTKMISPLEVIERVVTKWSEMGKPLDLLSSVEGFVRQILGWREYMRCVYWLHMPDYAKLNYFNHDRPLPSWFWTGDCKMNCLKHSIKQSLDHAYAHHIQRLMVTGNFALLAGIHPDEVDQWYLGIYIDAIEWVELPNTRGMSQYADGGIVGTKPYVSSANYIDSMSDYCKSCVYDKKKRHGANACPFNSLYWDFYHRNEELLSKNPRIGMAYVTLNKMDTEEKSNILKQANHWLTNIEHI